MLHSALCHSYYDTRGRCDRQSTRHLPHSPNSSYNLCKLHVSRLPSSHSSLDQLPIFYNVHGQDLCSRPTSGSSLSSLLDPTQLFSLFMCKLRAAFYLSYLSSVSYLVYLLHSVLDWLHTASYLSYLSSLSYLVYLLHSVLGWLHRASYLSYLSSLSYLVYLLHSALGLFICKLPMASYLSSLSYLVY